MILFQVGKTFVNLTHVKKFEPWTDSHTKEERISLHYIDKEVENLNSSETKFLKEYLKTHTIIGGKK